jgi:hypothetical protein
MTRRLSLLLAAIASAVACASPTLPLPPPEAPTMSRGPDADHIALTASCGSAAQSAIINIVNTNPAIPGDLSVTASTANACGGWDAPSVLAHNGDVLNITQQFAGEVSDATSVAVDVP